MDKRIADQLKSAVENHDKTLIGGRTATDKTPPLNTLRKYLPSDGRDLLIEDASKIHMAQDSLIRFEARRLQNGLAAVTIQDLLKASLRDRPDRIILDEIRSGEAFDLLQLLNTAHSGSLSTVHATSATHPQTVGDTRGTAPLE